MDWMPGSASNADDVALLAEFRRGHAPAFDAIVRRHYSGLLRVAEQRCGVSALAEDAMFLTIPARLAKRLLALARLYGKQTPRGIRIDLKLTQQELGELVGATRESVNKQIRAWSEAFSVSSVARRLSASDFPTRSDSVSPRRRSK